MGYALLVDMIKSMWARRPDIVHTADEPESAAGQSALCLTRSLDGL